MLPFLLTYYINLFQYLASLVKPFQAHGRRYAAVLTIGFIWAFAAILTAAGAFKNSSPKTQFYCRTDRSNLISAASWCVYLSKHTAFASFFTIVFLTLMSLMKGVCSYSFVYYRQTSDYITFALLYAVL